MPRKIRLNKFTLSPGDVILPLDSVRDESRGLFERRVYELENRKDVAPSCAVF